MYSGYIEESIGIWDGKEDCYKDDQGRMDDFALRNKIKTVIVNKAEVLS